MIGTLSTREALEKFLTDFREKIRPNLGKFELTNPKAELMNLVLTINEFAVELIILEPEQGTPKALTGERANQAFLLIATAQEMITLLKEKKIPGEGELDNFERLLEKVSNIHCEN